jgi:hypothetical protein
MRLRRYVAFLVIPLTVAGCRTAPHTVITIDEARAELLGDLWDVTAADGYRYQLTDDRGQLMGPIEIIQVNPNEYAAVYHWSQNPFRVALATSSNLLDWTWRVDLAEYASQPTIKEASDGGFVAAWEQEPPTQDESHLQFAYYPTWEDLLAASPSKTFAAQRLLSPCAEGTPNLYSASSTRIEFGFHYYAGCDADRQARGTTDWVTWDAQREPLLDRAVLFQGYTGSIGDRTVVDFHGYRFTFIEASFTLGDWSSFRVLVYDEGTGAADRAAFPDPLPDPYPVIGPPAEPPSEHVFIRTHRASYSLSNMSLAWVELDGKPALVVGVFILHPGLGGDEGGELIYYRFVDG